MGATGMPVLAKTAPPSPLPEWVEPKGLEEARFAIVSLGRSMHEHAYSLGRYLSWVKEQGGHGNFLPWLEMNVKQFSHSTACRLMRFADDCDHDDRLLEYGPRKYVTVPYLPPPGLPSGKFCLLYADPPWQYQNTSESYRGRIERHYPTMPFEMIAEQEVQGRPIADLAADDAVLFLWATPPKMEEALYVLNQWGFSYVTNMIWDKERIGMGYWFRQQHEMLFVGRKGNIPVPPPEARQRSVLRSPRQAHSQKPEAVAHYLEAMYPMLTQEHRIELYARQPREGWTVWGNEVSPEACEPVQTGCTAKENAQLDGSMLGIYTGGVPVHVPVQVQRNS